MELDPHSHAPKSSESLPKRVALIITAKGEKNLEWNVQQVHMGMMVRGAHTFGHTVYVYFILYACSSLRLLQTFFCKAILWGKIIFNVDLLDNRLVYLIVSGVFFS